MPYGPSHWLLWPQKVTNLFHNFVRAKVQIKIKFAISFIFNSIFLHFGEFKGHRTFLRSSTALTPTIYLYVFFFSFLHIVVSSSILVLINFDILMWFQHVPHRNLALTFFLVYSLTKFFITLNDKAYFHWILLLSFFHIFFSGAVLSLDKINTTIPLKGIGVLRENLFSEIK